MRAREPAPGCRVEVCLVGVELAARYLRSILENQPNIRILCEKEVSRRSGEAELRSPVFVVDMDSIPNSLSGCFRSIRARAPGAKIILLGRKLPEEELCSLLFLGIDGFVPYNGTPDELLVAIQAVSQGHSWIQHSVLEKFLAYSHIAGGARARRLHYKRQLTQNARDAFTIREKLIFGLIQRRFSNKEIASALGISENTVKFHMSNILAKLGVHDRHSFPYLGGSSAPEEKAKNDICASQGKAPSV